MVIERLSRFMEAPWSSGERGLLTIRAIVLGRGFDPCQMLDGSGVKAMPGSIPTPNSGSL